MSKAWYVFRTKPRQERTAEEHLADQNYEVYVPRMRTGVRQVVQPMFPDYGFLHLCDETEDWGPIRSTRGVKGLVKFGIVPAQCRPGLVEMLMELEGPDGVHDPGEALKRGDLVTITKEGNYKYYQAIMECKTGKERAMFLLMVSGNKEVRLELRLSEVEPIT